MEDRHYLVGTAGHVDHGKTELIRALTGIETDRLKEEKLRGISIELGFAHMTLPNGNLVGIVDVPGHEKFVRQMLAGASGMDAVLFVVAADEGMMPQSKEHLDIITLLGIETGIVVMTKIDLVDEEWLELVTEEIREEIKESVLAEVPICPVSSRTGQGIPELKLKIEQALEQAQAKKTQGPVLMPVDRVFSVQGFGTVVTGTLHRGTIEVGQELEIGPQGFVAKVRSLQVHGKKVNKAKAGQRTAVNVSGIEVGQVDRGSVLMTAGAFQEGQIIDVRLKHLASTTKPIVHRQRIRFHLGTAEVLGRIHLLEGEELPAGKESYGQILLEEPVVAAQGDKFVLRFYSPAFTIGGGKVLGLAPRKRRRFRKEVLEDLSRRDKGDPAELMIDILLSPMSQSELLQTVKLSKEETLILLKELISGGTVKEWESEGDSIYWVQESYLKWQERLIKQLKDYEKTYPLRLGIGREELKNLLHIKWPHRRWQLILEEEAQKGLYKVEGNKVRVKDPLPLPEKIKLALDGLYEQLEKGGLTPPDLTEVSLKCGLDKNLLPEYLAYLSETGKLVAIAGLYFSSNAVEKAKEDLLNYLKQQGETSVAEVRELWGTTRKYAVPLLEYFDQIKLTRREGDKRILYNRGEN